MVSDISMVFRVKLRELWSLYNYMEPLKQLYIGSRFCDHYF